jgi:hypothetical protein
MFTTRKIYTILVLFLAILLCSPFVYASEITGNLSTAVVPADSGSLSGTVVGGSSGSSSGGGSGGGSSFGSQGSGGGGGGGTSFASNGGSSANPAGEGITPSAPEAGGGQAQPKSLAALTDGNQYMTGVGNDEEVTVLPEQDEDLSASVANTVLGINQWVALVILLAAVAAIGYGVNRYLLWKADQDRLY